MSPPEPDWTAQLDQTLAATRDFAKAAGTFYKELLEQDVPALYAIQLTQGYVSAMVVASMGQDED